MRNFLLIAALVVLALTTWSDGAPSQAREQNVNDYNSFSRHPSPHYYQQLRAGETSVPARAQDPRHNNGQQLRAGETSVAVRAQDPRHNNGQQLRAGETSVQARAQDPRHNNGQQLRAGETSVPVRAQDPRYNGLGLSFTGQPQNGVTPSDRFDDAVAATQGQVGGSDLKTPNPNARCILCNGGACPECYMMDHSGVCRPRYGCISWDQSAGYKVRLLSLVTLYLSLNGSEIDATRSKDRRVQSPAVVPRHTLPRVTRLRD